MPFIIQAAYKGGPYTQKQASNRHFAEEPHVGGVLFFRKGVPVTISDEQFKACEFDLKCLFEAEAITIEHVGGDATISNEEAADQAESKRLEEQAAADLKAKIEAEEAAALAAAAAQPPAEEPGAAHEAAVAVAEEAVQEQEAATPELEQPAPEATPSSSKKKGRK